MFIIDIIEAIFRKLFETLSKKTGQRFRHLLKHSIAPNRKSENTPTTFDRPILITNLLQCP